MGQLAAAVLLAAALSVASCDRVIRPSGGASQVISTLFQPNPQAARGTVAVGAPSGLVLGPLPYCTAGAGWYLPHPFSLGVTIVLSLFVFAGHFGLGSYPKGQDQKLTDVLHAEGLPKLLRRQQLGNADQERSVGYAVAARLRRLSRDHLLQSLGLHCRRCIRIGNSVYHGRAHLRVLQVSSVVVRGAILHPPLPYLLTRTQMI